MALWPPEYELLRPEARAVAAAIGAAMTSGLTIDDPVERLIQRRAMVAALERRSSSGHDVVIAGVRCRRFAAGRRSRGLYLHMHGGAMMLGSPLLNDEANAQLCDQVGLDVVSIDYRLAPEHPHPAAVDDCVAVAAELLDGGAGPVVIGGESAGAYLAVMTLLRLRDARGSVGAIRAANLTFGPYDLSGTPSQRGMRPSRATTEPAEPPELFRAAYLPGRSEEELRNPDISPLYAELWGMPRALFTVGTADRLLDDTLFMARRWEAYGNDAELAVFPDCGHAFSGLPMELARIANERIFTYINHSIAGG